MRAVVIRAPGGPEVLEVRELPDPPVPAGHVRVAVRYAGVNRADLLQRRGAYPSPPGAPADVPGLEYAGVVESVGEGVRSLAPGERVFGIVGGGAYAELLVVHEREAARVPEGLDDRDAAALPEAGLTAYDALFTQARLEPGERVLVHAAGSGVGTAALQLAAQAGAFVVGTSRTLEKLERCADLGLAVGVVTRGEGFAREVLEATAGRGVDVVLDLVGGAYLPETLRACAPRARVVLVGLTAGARAEIDLGLVLSRRIALRGTVLRSRPLEEKLELAAVLRDRLAPLAARRRLRPIVDRTFSLAEAPAAHAHLEGNASFGKALLEVGA
ncbi:MAG TPA: NAD(P)H-quinone oxidoreductase [Polyangiaceae bacterium]|nr:NAD(P)H-quinone oxidoreductase [Polyangiaceae bacterium]